MEPVSDVTAVLQACIHISTNTDDNVCYNDLLIMADGSNKFTPRLVPLKMQARLVAVSTTLYCNFSKSLNTFFLCFTTNRALTLAFLFLPDILLVLN